MNKNLHLVLAQLNPTVGDLSDNARQILNAWQESDPTADLIIFPELVLCGYPPEDLILKNMFLDETEKTLGRLVKDSAGLKPAALIGAPFRKDGLTYNACYLIQDGRILSVTLKHRLPNSGIFDEKRIFAEGPLPSPVIFKNIKIGILICEDMWADEVPAHLKAQGAELLIIPNASPYDTCNAKRRREEARKRGIETGLPIVYVNQVGGQDDLVFDGHSFVADEKGDIIFSGAAFADQIYPVTLAQRNNLSWYCPDGVLAPALTAQEEIYRALVLGLKDYVGKNNFPGVLIGLSGGIDSALAALLAVDALGADHVHCVMMPSRYTSADSVEDAGILAKNLSVTLRDISIENPVAAFDALLKPFLPGHSPAITFENIQPRTRGVILMALSNATGNMVLTTGNKSEIATGYATLYGDMCGGFNPLKDLYKTDIYALARWRNGNRPGGLAGPQSAVVPERIFTKAPTAELKDNQTDQDTLPPYEILDRILQGLIEEDLGLDDIVARGHDRALVARIWAMLDGAEYKRRQAAPGTKIHPRAFGRDRRIPITHKFLKQIEKSGL